MAAQLDGQPLPLPSRKASALLAYLAVTAQPHSRDALAALLWPEADQARGRASLRQAAFALRQAGLGAWLEPEGEQLALKPGYRLDVAEFRQHLARAAAHRHAAEAPCPDCLGWLGQAAALYRGDFLAGLAVADSAEFEGWQQAAAEGLRQGLAGALERLAAQQGLAAEWEGAIQSARRWVGLDPLNEPAQRALIRLYARAGQRSQARQQYESLRETLQRELGVEPEAASQALYREIAAGRLASDRPVPESFGLPPLPERPRHNLPAALTSFVGREQALADAKILLGRSRLMTLTGTGGSGKTRLALRLARDVLEAYPGGVWLVELAALSDPPFVPKAVAATLQVQEPGGDLVAVLIGHLRARGALLLVLDNCEHVLAACAELCARLLAACPALQILATSREVLAIPGEQAWPVPTLSLPAAVPVRAGDGQSLAPYFESEAVRLFVERAQSAVPEFALTAETAPAVGQIARQLDGLPLGLELAAARVRVLSVQQIASRLDDTFSLLTRGGASLPARQQTLRAAMDWSHALLTEAERVLFRRLAVFAGGFTLEGAESVCSTAKDEVATLRVKDGLPRSQFHPSAFILPPSDVLDLLTNLVDKSLVAVEPTASGDPRYRLLEPIRQYAREHLAGAGEMDSVRGRHLAYYGRLGERVRREFRSAQQHELASRLDRELDNIRVALQWALEHNVEAGVELAMGLWDYWYLRSDQDEGARWLQAFLARPELPRSGLRARAMAYASMLMEESFYDQSALALAEEALPLARQLRDPHALAATLLAKSGLVLFVDPAQEPAMAAEALTLARQVGDAFGELHALGLLGHVALRYQHDYPAAADYFGQNADISRRSGDQWGLADALHNRGRVAALQGDWGRARAYYAEALALQRQVGAPRWLARAMCRLAWAEMQLGRFAAAEALLDGVTAIEQQSAGDSLLVESRQFLAYLAWHIGEYQRARELFATELRMVRERGAAATRGILPLTGLAMVALVQGETAAAREYLQEVFAAGADVPAFGIHLDPYLPAAMLALADVQPVRAATLLGAVLAVSDAAGYVPGPLERADWERCANAVREQLGATAFEAVMAQGRALTPGQAIEYALAVLDGSTDTRN
jgi:predicted ATPase/DNA-binding SARP family transcriptional activator